MIDIARILAQSDLRHLDWLDQIDSTNDKALLLADDPSTATPFLIGADQQTAGRGRGTNRWWGGPGSLMFSVGVEMSEFGLVASQWPRFSLVTGLAVAEMLRTVLPHSMIGLKWPNDIWIDGRKVCGILIEQCDRMPGRLVVGIGINVNNSFDNAPADQRRVAISMHDAAGGQSFSRTDILIEFLNRWRELTRQLADGRLNLPEQWSRACVLSGNAVILTGGDRESSGICAGIDEEGCLLVRTAFALERHYAGTVRLM